MRKYQNNSGCIMEFEYDVPLDQIKERLSWMGDDWKEVDQ